MLFLYSDKSIILTYRSENWQWLKSFTFFFSVFETLASNHKYIKEFPIKIAEPKHTAKTWKAIAATPLQSEQFLRAVL